MSKIRSIADEIRERIRSAGEAPQENLAVPALVEIKKAGKKMTVGCGDDNVAGFFDELAAFRMEGTQKIMVRLDPDSMKLLKQLKFTRGIDMTKVIVFALHKFLSENSWLQPHVLELLKSQNYEME